MGNKQNHRVLVVDDESDILELLDYNLTKEGYEVKTATDGKSAIEKAKKFQPQLILLDIMMPNQDGVETCRQLREIPEAANAFIIFLTARSEEYSEVAAFENGADDYITKPIKPRALMSRINAYFRRDVKKQKDSNKINIGGLSIDRTSYTVTVDGKQVSLPKKEFELLFYLAGKKGKVFDRQTLLNEVWGDNIYVIDRTIDVHIRKIREKLGDDYIETVKGVGYRFKE